MARNITAPNSKVRAFHVESVCDKYRRRSKGVMDFAGGDGGGAGFISVSGEMPMGEADLSLVMLEDR